MNVRAAKCQNKHLCNTKELFESSLFCLVLNEVKITNEQSKKNIKQCHEECYVRRGDVLCSLLVDTYVNFSWS